MREHELLEFTDLLNKKGFSVEDRGEGIFELWNSREGKEYGLIIFDVSRNKIRFSGEFSKYSKTAKDTLKSLILNSYQKAMVEKT